MPWPGTETPPGFPDGVRLLSLSFASGVPPAGSLPHDLPTPAAAHASDQSQYDGSHKGECRAHDDQIQPLGDDHWVLLLASLRCLRILNITPLAAHAKLF